MTLTKQQRQILQIMADHPAGARFGTGTRDGLSWMRSDDRRIAHISGYTYPEYFLKQRGLIEIATPGIYALTEKGKQAVAAFRITPRIPRPWF